MELKKLTPQQSTNFHWYITSFKKSQNITDIDNYIIQSKSKHTYTTFKKNKATFVSVFAWKG